MLGVDVGDELDEATPFGELEQAKKVEQGERKKHEANYSRNLIPMSQSRSDGIVRGWTLGDHGTSWEPRPSSIIAKRPDDSISCRPARKKAGALARRLPEWRRPDGPFQVRRSPNIAESFRCVRWWRNTLWLSASQVPS